VTTALLSETINQVYAQAPEPTLKAEPSLYMAGELGEEFNLNITIYNIVASLHLIGIHFRLSYDSELLEVVDVIEGDFLPKFNQTSIPPATLCMWAAETGIYGSHLVVGNILLPNATGKYPGPYPEGNGTVVSITFKVIYQPVEPESIQVCLLRFLEVILLDDQGAEITYKTSMSLYESPEPMLYSEPSFMYQPECPMAGQVILFDATGSEDPDGNITTYSWDFDDGTTLSTNESIVTHMYTQPKTYNVTLYTIDDDGLMSNISIPIQVGFYTPIKIEIETGKVYYPGEITEFYILTSQLGRAFNVTFTKLLLYFNGTVYDNLSNLTQAIGDGFYQVSYTIPGEAKTGVYNLLVEVEFSGITNRKIASFQLSDTLTSISNMSNAIIKISEDVGEILTEIGELKFNLTEINAKLIGIEGTIGIINSTIGTLEIDVEKLNTTITNLVVDSKGEILLHVTTSLNPLTLKLDSIDGKISTVNESTVTISTKLGDIETKLTDTQSVATTTLYATSALSAIAVILAAVILMLLRKG
jgi:hypothetical protein